jgi:hypothetical protein
VWLTQNTQRYTKRDVTIHTNALIFLPDRLNFDKFLTSPRQQPQTTRRVIYLLMKFASEGWSDEHSFLERGKSKIIDKGWRLNHLEYAFHVRSLNPEWFSDVESPGNSPFPLPLSFMIEIVFCKVTKRGFGRSRGSTWLSKLNFVICIGKVEKKRPLFSALKLSRGIKLSFSWGGEGQH